MPAIRQRSFAAGELAPTWWGRDDLEKYGSGARRMWNSFPIAPGAWMNRPGSGLVSARADRDHSKAAVFIPFIYSELANQAYALELGDGYLRFIVAGGYVAPDPAQYSAYAAGTTYAKGAWVTSGGVAYMSLQNANTGHDPASSPTWWTTNGGIYELVTPYAADHLARVQYAQEGDLVTLVRHGYAPRELRRYTHAKWTLSTATFIPRSGVVDPADPRGGVPFVYIDMDSSRAVTAAQIKPVDYALSLILRDDATGLEQETWAETPSRGGAIGGPIKDQTVPAWNAGTTYKVTGNLIMEEGTLTPLVCRGSDGLIYQTEQDGNIGHDPTLDNGTWWEPVHVGYQPNWATRPGGVHRGISLLEDRPIIGWANVVAPTGFTIVGFRVYRGRYDVNVWGLLADLPATATFYQDDGTIDPDFAQNPRSVTNPFETAWPACVDYFERRRVFANLATGAAATPFQPAVVRASATEEWGNFDSAVVPSDDDAVEFTVASRLREEVRWIRGTHRLLLGSSSGVWAAGGAEGTPLGPHSIDARLQSEEGADWLPPILIGDQVLYVTARGLAIRELVYDDTRRKFLGADLTFLARHFFEGHRIVDWAYQRHPHEILWAVRDDGHLLSLTYKRELDVYGLAEHELAGGGAVERLCIIPEGEEDSIYLFVRRVVGGATKRYVERLTSRQITDARLGVFLDAALSYDGRNTTAQKLGVESFVGWDGGVEVDLYSDPVGYFVAGDVGKTFVLDPDGTPVALLVTQLVTASRVKAVVQNGSVPAAFRGAYATNWGRAATQFSGLGHLEGETVVALADGNVVRADAAAAPLVVTGGAITIPEPAVIVHVGLPYVSDLDLLDLGGSADARGKEKIVSKVIVEIEKSRGLQVGKDFDSLSAWKQRAVADGYGPVPLVTGRAEVLVSGEWAKTGRAVVRQADPLPCCVVAVTREVTVA